MNKLSVSLFTAILCIFCFQCQPPSLPCGIFPLDGQVLSPNISDKMVLRWPLATAKNPDMDLSYIIRIYQVDSSALKGSQNEFYYKPIIEDEVKQNFYRVPNGLKEGQVYGWEVLARVAKYDTIIQGFTSFSISDLKSLQRPDEPESTCKVIFSRYLYVQRLDSCILQEIEVDCPGPITHIATGSLGFSSNSASEIRFGTHIDPIHDCIIVDDDSRICVNIVFTVTTSSENLTRLDQEEISIKVFKHQTPLEDSQIQKYYKSLGNEAAVPFILTQGDYEHLCIQQEPQAQATIMITLCFPIEYHWMSDFPKNYSIALELNPTGQHLNEDGEVHGHGSSICSACQEHEPGSFAYYDCIENEDCPLSDHIVLLPIDPSLICGTRDRPIVILDRDALDTYQVYVESSDFVYRVNQNR